MDFEPFHELILKLKDNEITRDYFVFMWDQCQIAQKEPEIKR